MKLFDEIMKDATVQSVHIPSAFGRDNFKFGRGRSQPKRKFRHVGKAWSLPLEIKKFVPDQQLIFGWASVIEKDGKVIIDKQGDVISVEELENAAYEFVLTSRDHGDMHKRTSTGKLVESMVFTIEKQEALGINLGQVGWWTGFKVNDRVLWEAHKRGERPEFSIGGAAVPVEIV